jgi:hypothetical protein
VQFKVETLNVEDHAWGRLGSLSGPDDPCSFGELQVYVGTAASHPAVNVLLTPTSLTKTCPFFSIRMEPGSSQGFQVGDHRN